MGKQYIFDKIMGLDILYGMDIEIIDIQPANKCFLLKDKKSGQEFKLRVNSIGNENIAENEFAAYEFLKDTSAISVLPRLIYFNFKKGILISEYIKGNALNKYFDYSSDDVHKIYLGIIEEVSKIHAVKSRINEYPAQIEFSSWSEYFYHKLNDSISRIPFEFLDMNARNKVLGLFHKNKEYFDNVETCCIHGDLRCHNVIYDKDTERVRLIDFESVMVGDPNFDLLRIMCDDQLVSALPSKDVIEKNEIYVLYYIEMLMYWFGSSYKKKNVVEQFAIDNWYRILSKINI